MCQVAAVFDQSKGTGHHSIATISKELGFEETLGHDPSSDHREHHHAEKQGERMRYPETSHLDYYSLIQP